MMRLYSPTNIEIDSALKANLQTLQEAFFDLLAALLLCLLGLVSLLHAVCRLAFGFLGLLLWSLALITVFLSWLRGLAAARSSSSLHWRSEQWK